MLASERLGGRPPSGGAPDPRNVQEVYADDEALRKTNFYIIKKHLEVEDDSGGKSIAGP